MCQRCAYEIANKGIRDTDLQYLPYTECWHYCIVEGCRGRCKVRDYGIAPFYYWPVKVKYLKRGWRGGWFEATHAHMCGRHWKMIEKRQISMPDRSAEVCLSRIKPVKQVLRNITT